MNFKCLRVTRPVQYTPIAEICTETLCTVIPLVPGSTYFGKLTRAGHESEYYVHTHTSMLTNTNSCSYKPYTLNTMTIDSCTS